MSADDPFERLGIAPTLDRVRIKRAYFDALARHPPHRDAEAFARVRSAYEALMRPGGPEAASLQSPPDPVADALEYRERYADRIDAARARLREREANDAAVAAFVARLRRTPLAMLLDELERERP